MQAVKDQMGCLEPESPKKESDIDTKNECSCQNSICEERRNDLHSKALESELARSEEEIRVLRSSVLCDDGRISELEERLSAVLASLEESERELDLTKCQADGLSRTLDVRAEERQEFIMEMESLRESVSALTEELESKTFEVERLLDELKTTRDDLNVAQRKLSQSERGVTRRCSEVAEEDLRESKLTMNEKENHGPCDKTSTNEQCDNQQCGGDSSSTVLTDGGDAPEVIVIDAVRETLKEECDRLALRVEELEQQKVRLEGANEGLRSQLEEVEGKMREFETKYDELDSQYSSQKRQLPEVHRNLEDFGSDLEMTRAAGTSSTRVSTSSGRTVDLEVTDVDMLRVQLKATQLGFLKELETLKKIVIPNFVPRMTVNSLSFTQRTFLSKLYELEAGKFENVSIATLPCERSFTSRDLYVEVSRLEGIASGQRDQLKALEVCLSNS